MKPVGLERGYLAVIASLLIIGSVQAEGVRRDAAGGSDAVRKAQYMLRQLSDEKARLEADNASLSAEVATLKEQLAGLENKLRKSESSNGKLVSRVKNDHEKMRQLIDRYKDALSLLRMEKANVAHLKNAVQERSEWIDTCKSNNDSLYQVNLELVERFQNKSIWQALSQAEPLTGIGDVKLEVIAEDYIYRIEDLQVADFKKEND